MDPLPIGTDIDPPTSPLDSAGPKFWVWGRLAPPENILFYLFLQNSHDCPGECLRQIWYEYLEALYLGNVDGKSPCISNGAPIKYSQS